MKSMHYFESENNSPSKRQGKIILVFADLPTVSFAVSHTIFYLFTQSHDNNSVSPNFFFFLKILKILMTFHLKCYHLLPRFCHIKPLTTSRCLALFPCNLCKVYMWAADANTIHFYMFLYGKITIS